jgi:antitoxin (DNA-binding transcriptional repressor) of toxin-antitoxin stability system
MKTATTHYAKTHLSRLLKEVQNGETVVILSGKHPVGRLTGEEKRKSVRPKVGTVTSGPVTISKDAFAPLAEQELKEWGV